MRLAAAISIAVSMWAASPGTGPQAVNIPYWVTTGEPAASVVAKADGQAVKVLRTRGPDHDMVLLIVLDLAGDLAQVDPAREALNAAVEKLPANVFVGLLRAQDGLRVLLDPRPDRAEIREAVDALNISGRAGLLDTIETAAQLADSMLAKANVRTALLYVTDSSIGNYREDYTNPVVNSTDSRDMSRRFPEGLVKEKISQLAARLAPRQTPIFMVHLAYQNDRLNEAYQTGLLEIAGTSGGSAAFCRTVAEIPDAIAETFSTITALQSAEIQLGPTKAKQVAIELSAEGRMLRYRQRITPRK
jgi:hypothetical protein